MDRTETGGFHGAFRQSMSWLHTWVGLVLGVVLYFMFVTGTTGYAHYEITRWMQPELGVQTGEDTVGDTAQMAEAALAYTLAEQPRAPLIYLTLPNSGREGGSAVDIYADPPTLTDGQEGGKPLEVTLDPATMLPLDGSTMRETGGGEVLYAMHYNLHYIPFESLTLFGFTFPAWPTLIVGVATMFMLVAILTGIVVHKKIFADFFTFRPGKGQRSWLDAHNLSSVLALPFMMMITYSGLVMYAYEYMPTVKTVAYGTPEIADPKLVDCELYDFGCSRREPSGEAALMAPLAPMVAQFSAMFPGEEIKWIDIFNAGDRNATVDMWAAENSEIRLEWPLITFDAVTGEILETKGGAVDNASPANPVGKFGDVLLALHEGTFAGPMLRWLYLLTGAIGAAMVATGLVLWSVKRRQKLKATDRADLGLAFVERTNVGIIVGLLIAVAAYFWANRLLPVGMEGRADWEVNAMFLTWAAMLIHAALRPARRAWVEQWTLAALAYGLIPVLNAVTTEIHLVATLAAGDWALASFDLTMIVLGLIFAVTACKAAQKASGASRPTQTIASTDPAMEPAE
jgi:uncharacterized iron-regulated membrane protein